MKDFFSDLPMQKSNFEGEVDNPSPNPQIPVQLTPEEKIIISVVDITKESIRCFTEYVKCREHEITERKRINATLKAVQYQIDAQKEVYLKELEQNYEERNRLYDMAEKAQEKALELGDKEMLKMCYDLILNIYTKSVGNTDGMPSLLGGTYTPF